MHKFNTLKYGGGAVTLLPQHVAQRMVRHVSKRNGRNGIGRFGEEVQNHGQFRMLFCTKHSLSRRISKCDIRQFVDKYQREKRQLDSIQNGGVFDKSSHWSTLLFYHACGGRNHLLTEVAA